jgi:hypothetical protein
MNVNPSTGLSFCARIFNVSLGDSISFASGIEIYEIALCPVLNVLG